MPFTPSHAVLALPFIRTPLIPAAIAIGAMTPDLPLFVRGIGLSYGFTHDDGNIIWTTFIALALFLVWRGVLRPAVRELSPSAIARRLPGDWDTPALPSMAAAIGVGESRFYSLRLVLSLMLGVLSHILWDLFTHEGRWGSELLPILDDQWGPLQGFKWLQHGSSAVGLVVIGIWMLLWLRRRTDADASARVLPDAARMVWWLSLPVVLIVAVIGGYVAFGPFTGGFTVQHLAYRVLPPACALWGLATLVLCLVIGLRRR